MKQGSAMRASSVAPCAGFARHAVAASIAAAFGTVMAPAWAQVTLPSGHQVVSGTAGVSTNGGTMTITNSPNAVLNWQSFSIGEGGTVRFDQASASSKVLNRVVGGNASNIMGSLTSNGSVWLINQNGILFGQNANVNVAGLVASTLDLTDDDFLAGRGRFNSGTQVRPQVHNQGRIETVDGGQVWLVGGSVRNSGHIEIVGSEFNTGQSGPKGNVTLASGTSVELVDSSLPNITIQVTGTDFAVENVGTILAGRGTVDLFGGIVNQTGMVRADTLEGDAGTISIRGKANVTLGSITSADTEEPGTSAGVIQVSSETADVSVNGLVSAKGGEGGVIAIDGRRITVSDPARLEATGISNGGVVSLNATDALSINGLVSAAGISYEGDDGPRGMGGVVSLQGAAVSVSQNALVDTSGAAGGSVSVSAVAGALNVRGELSSTGVESGGAMRLSGQQVDVAQGAVLDSSGEYGGAIWVSAENGLLSIDGTILSEGALGGGAQLLTGTEVAIGEPGQSRTSGGALEIEAKGGPLVVRGWISTARTDGFSGAVSLSGKGIQLLDRSNVSTGGGAVELNATASSDGTPGELLMQYNTLDAGSGHIRMTADRIKLSNASITSRGFEDAIYMRTGAFANTNSTLNVSNGRWLVFLNNGADFNANAFSGLDYSFVEAGVSEGVEVDRSGNGILLSNPLNIQVRLDASREYDRTTDASFTDALSNDADSRGIRILRKSDWTSETGVFTDKRAGNNKSIIVDNGNDLFEVRTVSGAPVYGATQNYVANITPRPVIYSVEIPDKVYDGDTSAWMMPRGLTGVLEGDDVIHNISADFDTKHVGTSKPVTVHFTLEGPDAGNYTAQAPTGLTASITPLPITAAGIIAADKVYDGTRDASLSGSLAGVLDDDDVTLDATGALFDTKNVGTNKTVSFSGGLRGTDAGNYSFNGPLSTTASITPRPAQINITGQVAKGYDGSGGATLAADQYALAGILASDAVAVRGPTEGDYDNANAGNGKTVVVDGSFDISGADAYNYSFGGVQLSNTTSNTITARATTNQGLITPRQLGWFGLLAQDKVYDGNREAVVNGTLTNIVTGDSVAFGGVQGLFDTKNTGTGKTVTVTAGELSGTHAGNYLLPVPATTSAAIAPRPLSAEGLVAADKVYDGTVAASVSGALTGIIAGDDVSFSVGSAVFDTKNVGNNKRVSFAGGPLGGADGGNYLLDGPLSLTASITPRPVLVDFTGTIRKEYDGTTIAEIGAGQYRVSGLIAGDVVSVNGPQAGSYDTASAGTGKTVTIDGPVTLGGADAGNYLYEGVSLGAVGEITPRQLAFTGVSAQDRVYDATRNATVNAALSNVVAGDEVLLAGLTGLFDTKNAGNGKTVTVSATGLGGAHAGNYRLPILGATTTANISPRPASAANLVAADKVYDGSTSASVSGALTGILAGDVVSLSLGSAAFDSKNVGADKSVTLSGSALGGADAGNYVLDGSLSTTASITQRPVQVGLTGTVRKEYDGTTAAPIGADQYSLSGIIAGDAVSINGPQQASFDTATVGSGKTVTVSGPVTLGGADAGNYSYNGVALGAVGEITPRQLTLTGATAQNRVYDGSRAATVGASLSNVVGNDDVRLAGLNGQFDTKDAGNGKAVSVSATGLSGAQAGNYILPVSAATTTASIAPRPISGAGIGASDKVYDGTRTGTLTGSFTDVLAGDNVAIGGTSVVFDSKDAGTNKLVSFTGTVLSGADAGNYILSAPLTARASILPRPVAIALSAAVQKEYDAGTAASIAANGYALQGAIAGDQLIVTGPTQGSFDSASAGQQKTVSVNGPFAVSGADARNYSIGGVPLANAPAGGVTASASGRVGTITPAVLTYVADPATRDTAVPLVALGGTVTGFKGSDTLASATTGTLQWESAAKPGSNPGSYAIQGSGLTAANYVFVQAPGNTQALLLRPNQSFNAGSANRSAAIASAVAATEPVRGLPSSGSAVLDVSSPSAARSFGSVRIGSMNQQELAQLMAQRRDFKRKLFADAVYKLEIDPSLADIRPCTSVAEAANGACRISAAQLQLIHASQQQALPAKKLAKNLSLPQIERKIAVLIGINDYADKTIPRLENAVPDVEAVGKLFEEKLGYEVRVLRNSSKADIIRALNALSTEVGSSDSVIVYYAGHGYSLEKNGAGYWLPSDASANDPRQWISNSDVASILSNIRSRQMALISDSCYSGAFARDGMAAVGRNVKADDVLAKRSVVVLSSGGDEPVADEGKGNHSIFAWNLMQVVGSVSNWQPGSSIFETIQAGVKKEFPQTPKYGSVTAAGHQPGGDYLFEFRSN